MSSFAILVVCTGNVARSPMAERILQSLLVPAVDVSVSSAGTHGMIGQRMAPEAAQVLGEIGIEEGDFRARMLTPGLVRQADLVLTATREHRSAVLSESPSALRRTFTIKEMARLLAASRGTWLHPDVPPAAKPAPVREHATDLVSGAARTRGGAVTHPDADDIGDPYRRGITRFRACRDEVRSAAGVIASAMIVPSTVVTPTEGERP